MTAQEEGNFFVKALLVKAASFPILPGENTPRSARGRPLAPPLCIRRIHRGRELRFTPCCENGIGRLGLS